MKRREFITCSAARRLRRRSRRARSSPNACGGSVCFRYSPKATWTGVPVLKRFNTDSKSLGGQTAVTFKSIIAGLRAMLSA